MISPVVPLIASSLVNDWGKLKLTEDEEHVLDADDSTSNSLDSHIALCLVGKLLTKATFNVEALKGTLRNAWRPANDYALNEGPWAFDGSVLLLKQMHGLEQPSEMTFIKIKACDLLMKKKTYEFDESMASKFGDFVDVDEEDILAPSKYLKFRADVDITKPLRCGMMVNVKGVPKWVGFKYVKLPDFCYGCGKLGHVWKGCPGFALEMDESDLQYGSWMRGSPIR
ncbi:hypothetical protein Cgig2_019101 [Carnegiea gigantea]|uniref:CCHC-type domain-containing protein n=1 Tax=Carnegiea gigantea TaxID=171969 RepID=A0A9Q1KF16_9CARY|nr:hypothetical protein Cgig2_019101 [Carnegiea gigantea]